jgi:hypothetical protein
MRHVCLLLSLVLYALVLNSGCLAADPAKPAVPAGRDPGGIAVALIGNGIDYSQPSIAPRLARDGEGELIGWDFVDDDRRPLGSAAGIETSQANLLLHETTSARLIVVRTSDSRMDAFISAIAFVAQTPARIVLVSSPPDPQERRIGLLETARRAPALLFVASAKLIGQHAASVGNRRNILVVSVRGDGASPPGPPAPSADVSVETAAGAGVTAMADDVAVARIGALAARVLATEHQPDGASLKQRILELANPGRVPGQERWFANVGAIYRQE